MIIDIGLADYTRSIRMQKELVARRKRGEAGDSLILAEHPSVYTIGRSGSIRNLIRDDGVEVLNVDRGGDITFHGPGQLVIYPIIDLKSRGLDLHNYMRMLESAAILFLAGYGVSAGRLESKTGVWVGGEKIASIGIAASGWVSYHGMSINLNVDLEYFSRIHPCGMKDITVTSLGRIIGSHVDMQDAKDRFVKIFSGMIDLGETGDACIKYESAMA